ncbi:COP9 signalosome complex subunit 12 [Rhizodiscina lignyota]|uniref:Protein CSN12 homolog n=1 Tax=Rhizodiscina lignyota TaxID=1504668 RepID=A0A9P4MCQ5_9PEZI|nr:COP9 signalosome complex subunit 12 [Rhizodiscina lignyota]
MDAHLSQIREALRSQDGYALAAALTPAAPANDPTRLHTLYRDDITLNAVQAEIRHAVTYHDGVKLSKAERTAWTEVFGNHWKAIVEIVNAEQGRERDSSWTKAFEAWKEVLNALIRGYQTSVFEAWSIPCLYVGGNYLRKFAIKADKQAEIQQGSVTFNAGFQDDIVGALDQHETLEEAGRQINRIYTLCITDRAPLEESRKWGVYYVTNLLFKTYFMLNRISLCKNVMRSLQTTEPDLPPLDAFPKSQQVTFKYYAGVIYFLEEDYAKAEQYLTSAYELCHKDAQRNRELILTYLVPCHLVTTHTLPTPALLAPYPRLQALFTPLSRAIKRGDLGAFDAALTAGEEEFIKRRIYLTLERGRDIALRNLFRKVFIVGGFEPLKEGQTEEQRIRRTRIPIEEFAAAVRLASRVPGGEVNGGGFGAEEIEQDEVECLLANMIYKNLMKGYISREHGKVVLSKGGTAFPGTGV